MSHERDGGKIDEAAGGREPPSPGGDKDDPSFLRWPEDKVWWRWQRPSRGTIIWRLSVSLVAGSMIAFRNTRFIAQSRHIQVTDGVNIIDYV